MSFSKVIEIESRLSKGGLSKKEEAELLAKKMRLLNGSDGFGLYMFLYGILILSGIAFLITR